MMISFLLTTFLISTVGFNSYNVRIRNSPTVLFQLLDGDGVQLVNKEFPLTDDELSNENLIKIVNLSASDEDCNVLAWKCLGYRWDLGSNNWNSDHVFPKWRSKYPAPVDLIGVTQIYDPKIDMPVRKASIDLMRAIPRDFKGGIRTLQSVGFHGFKVSELTPRITRRAQLTNFILYYRDCLHGKSFEQLAAQAAAEVPKSAEEAALPSERNYQKLRIDIESTGPGNV